MKTTKTREETLAELARNSSKGAGAAKRFKSLVKRLTKIPPQPRTAIKKSRV